MVQRAHAPGEVELTEVGWQFGDVALDERDVRKFTGSLTGLVEQLGDEVDADHLGDDRRERERERAGPGAGIQGALLATGLHEAGDALCEVGTACLLELGQPTGLGRKSVAQSLGVSHLATLIQVPPTSSPPQP